MSVTLTQHFPEELKKFIAIALKESIPSGIVAFQQYIKDEVNNHKHSCEQRKCELEIKITSDSVRFDESWRQVFTLFMYPQNQLEFDTEMFSHKAAYYAALKEYEKQITSARINLDTTIMFENIDIEQKHTYLQSVFTDFINKLSTQYLCIECINNIIAGQTTILLKENNCFCQTYIPLIEQCETVNCFMCNVAKCSIHGELQEQFKTVDEYFFDECMDSLSNNDEKLSFQEEECIQCKNISLNNKPPTDKQRRQSKFNKKRRSRKKTLERKKNFAKQDKPAHSKKRYSQKKNKMFT